MLDLFNNKVWGKSVEFFESDKNYFEKHEIKENRDVFWRYMEIRQKMFKGNFIANKDNL